MKQIFFILLLASCQSSVLDGTYCAEIDRYNPKTGKESAYTLLVDIDDNFLDAVHWPNGGHSDSDDFGSVKFDSKTVSFSDNKGTQYKIEITGNDSNCFPDGSTLKQCTGIKSNGKRCKNKTGRPSGFCWRHDI
jgi:aryl-phospho-beta-D-glucosidase BglC (GH1 family)